MTDQVETKTDAHSDILDALNALKKYVQPVEPNPGDSKEEPSSTD